MEMDVEISCECGIRNLVLLLGLVVVIIGNMDHMSEYAPWGEEKLHEVVPV